VRPALEIEDLRMSFNACDALTGVTLNADRGEVLAVIGPNGAGKTTLISIVAGLLAPSSGCTRVLGLDATGESKALRGRIGLAGQDIAVYPAHTVEENLRFFGSLNGLRRRELTGAVEELLEVLQLGDLRKKRAAILSGGQRRRLHVGCALVYRPDVVMLDEPTAGADPETRQQLLRIVCQQASRGSLVVYTTHYLAEVEELRARVAVLAHGRIVAEGTVDRLIADHAASELALRFEGALPTVDWPGARVLADTLLLPTSNPTTDIVHALEAVAEHREQLCGLEIIRADLERAYFNIVTDGGCS
jgi:ABC-2 type transport system ATP-binding protein